MNEKSMTLGTDWDWMSQNPAGWFLSEKLDGCRAYFDGWNFWTRSGKEILVPDWFKAGLPEGVALDGEIHCGRGTFAKASAGVRFGKFDASFRFEIFDVPNVPGTWAQRMAFAPTTDCATPVPFRVCGGDLDLRNTFEKIKSSGGEGLMLRNPATIGYEIGRTKNLIKVK